ncbi:MAG: diguanylate cyclase [Actinomycetota bacterium]|nr:diguanylate cyclase [Actinomycetota bacterium]
MHRLHEREPDATAGIVFIDIDGSKHVNDTYGHATGERVLARAAELLTRGVRSPNSA